MCTGLVVLPLGQKCPKYCPQRFLEPGGGDNFHDPKNTDIAIDTTEPIFTIQKLHENILIIGCFTLTTRDP